MPNDIMPVAPTMARMYAEKARRGGADHYLSSTIAEFYVGNQVITIMSYDLLGHEQGHFRRVSADEIMKLKHAAHKQARKNTG